MRNHKKSIYFFQQEEYRQFLPPAKAGGFPCRTKMNGKLVDDITYGMVQVDPQWWMPIPPIPVDKNRKYEK
jgi:hypothetical protein